MKNSSIPAVLSLGKPLFLASSKEVVYFAYRQGSDIIVIHLAEGIRTYTAHDESEFITVPNRALTDLVKSNEISIQYGWFYLKDEIEQYPVDIFSKYVKKNQKYMLWYYLHLFSAEIPEFKDVNPNIIKTVKLSNIDISDGVIYSGYGLLLGVEYNTFDIIHHCKFLYPLFIDSVTTLGDLDVMINFIFDLDNNFNFKEGMQIENPSINEAVTRKATLHEWK